MACEMLTQTQQSPASALPGTWKLAAGRAITLQPRVAGVLRVAHGQMWATYDGPHAGPLNDLGDRVIGAGEELPLGPGQRLVIEAWDRSSPAYFSWETMPQRVHSPAPDLARVTQPLSDLRLALRLGAGAGRRLAVGLGSLAWDLATGRDRGRSRCREWAAAPP